MANFVFKFSKISHHGNKSWVNGKNLNSSIYLCVLFDDLLGLQADLVYSKFCVQIVQISLPWQQGLVAVK